MEKTNKTERLESQVQQEPEPTKNGTTFIRTCFNGINALSGVGVLSIPYALSEGGWLSLVILMMIAALCYYTGLLLKRCMDYSGLQLIKTYPDIGNLAFGKKGRKVISIFMYLLLYLLAVEFLILEGDNLHKLFPNVCIHLFGGHKVGGKQVFVLLAALVILPTTWLRSFGLLAYVSVGGVFATIILLSCVLWVGVEDDHVGFHHKGTLWNWKGLPTAISLYTFCYSGHAVLPTLCNSMKDRAQFNKVWLVCFVLNSATYISMATMGYLMFGGNLNSQITLNLPTKNLASKIAIYTTLINPITKYALIVAPIMTAIEDTTPFQGRRLLGLLIRTLLVITTVVVALTLPFFGYIMAFIGSFLSMGISVLFPCLCYLKIYKPYKKINFELVMIVVIVLIGVFFSVLGTYVSVRNIVTHVGK